MMLQYFLYERTRKNCILIMCMKDHLEVVSNQCDLDKSNMYKIYINFANSSLHVWFEFDCLSMVIFIFNKDDFILFFSYLYWGETSMKNHTH